MFDNYQKGYDLAKEGKYIEAQNVWLKCANKGNKDCMYGMGSLYLKDERLGNDPQKASSWFIKAADKGHAKAAYNAGLAYNNGAGVMRDFRLAEKYFLVSHEKGFVTGTYALGSLLRNKEYEGKDIEKSFYYTKIAADKGHVKGQLFTGLRYLSDNQGTKKDYQQAAKYLKMASDNGNLDALYWLGRTYAYDDNTTKNLPKAFEFLEKAKSYKVQDSYASLSILYADNSQYRKAFDVCVEGANLGDSNCHINLGNYYFKGQSVPKNLVQSTKHYIIANKIKYSSETADYILENMNSMSSYQQELARNYAKEWLDDNRNILNGEKFYQDKKNKNEITQNIQKEKKKKPSKKFENSNNSIVSNDIKKIDYKTVQYKGENLVLSTITDNIYSRNEKAFCERFTGNVNEYTKCEDSVFISYTRLVNIQNTDTMYLLGHGYAKIKSESNLFFSSRAVKIGKVNGKDVISGGWVRKTDGSLMHGTIDGKDDKWIAYTDRGGRFKSNTGLTSSQITPYIIRAKNNYKTALTIKEPIEKFINILK